MKPLNFHGCLYIQAYHPVYINKDFQKIFGIYIQAYYPVYKYLRVNVFKWALLWTPAPGVPAAPLQLSTGCPEGWRPQTHKTSNNRLKINPPHSAQSLARGLGQVVHIYTHIKKKNIQTQRSHRRKFRQKEAKLSWNNIYVEEYILSWPV